MHVLLLLRLNSLVRQVRYAHKNAPRANEASGFTLIELLVVVVVLGILMSIVVFSLNPSSDQRSLQGFAQRMAQRIELARDRAIQNNQEWGLKVGENDYGFFVYDDMERRWLPQRQRPFQPDDPPYPIQFEITVEAGGFSDIEPGVFDPRQTESGSGIDTDSDKDLPDVVFFSSGEASQFFVDVRPLRGEAGLRLMTDGLRPISVATLDTFTGKLQ